MEANRKFNLGFFFTYPTLCDQSDQMEESRVYGLLGASGKYGQPVQINQIFCGQPYFKIVVQNAVQLDRKSNPWFMGAMHI